MSLATEANTGGIVAAMEARHAAEDARTTARLDWWVKIAGRCYGCGAHVSDEVAAAHPGVCATCARRKKLKPLPVPTEFAVHTSPLPPAAPAVTRLAIVPAQPREEAMPRGKRDKPWPCCGSMSHRHKADCDKAGTGKAIDVPVTRKAKPGRERALVNGETPQPIVDQVAASETADLLALRDAIDDELRSRLAKREAEIKTLRDAIGSAA